MRNTLVGRETEILDIALVISRGEGVCVRGPAGIGKSSICDTFLSRQGPDLPVIRITAARATETIAFGALAPLLGSLPAATTETVQIVSLATAAIRSQAGSAAFVVAVDDVHLLDSASATVLHQLAREPGIVLLACCPDTAQLPRWLKKLIQADIVSDYWLGPLTRPSVDLLCANLLGGPPDSALADDVWDLSLGNPFRARQLIEGGLRGNSIGGDDGCRTALRPLVPTGLLASGLDELIALYSPDEVRVIELTAVNKMVPLQLLEDVESPGAVEKLESAGMLTVAADGNRHQVSLADRMLERHVLAMMPVTRSRRLERTYVDWLANANLRRRDDELVLATRHLECGVPLGPTLGLAAARGALVLGDAARAERFCRAVPSNTRTVDVDLILAETQFLQDRGDDSVHTLDGSLRRSCDDLERVRVAIARAELAVRAHGDLGHAGAILDETARVVTDAAGAALLEAELARHDVLRGSPATALCLQHSPSVDALPSVQIAQRAVAGAGSLLSAQYDRAIVEAEAAMTAIAAVADVGIDPSSRNNVELAAWTHIEALIGSGRSLEARQLFSSLTRSGIDGSDSRSKAFREVLDGTILAATGAVRPARAAFGRAIDLLDQRVDAYLLARAYGQRATCHAFASERGQLVADIAAVDDHRTRADHWTFIALHRASAWECALRGETEFASTQLHRLACEAVESGCISSALPLLHDCVRLGYPQLAVDGLAALATAAANPLADAYLVHANALVSASGQELDRVSESFAAMGALLLAGEAAHQAASAHQSGGDLGASRRSGLRADVLLGDCPGANTPAMRSIEVTLTRRQKQVASLAPLHSNSEIADRLSISVRTVENHLNAVFMTLDIHERSKLASVFLGSENL